jgi:signal transduction histidine kinase
MTQPLRVKIYATALVMILIMAGVLFMGTRQYQLRRDHHQIINQSEELLFSFALIRERMLAAMLAGKYAELPLISGELEKFHSRLSTFAKNPLIPAEYRINFAGQIDLSGLILALRKGDGPFNKKELAKVNAESRRFAERLMALDRLLVDYAKSKLIDFQNVAIGALAMVIFIVVNLLVMGQRSVVTPLLKLLQQVREISGGRRQKVSLQACRASQEVAVLAEAFQGLIDQRMSNISEWSRLERVMYAVHRAGTACGGAESINKLFKEVSRALLFNEDYCLVWIGIPDEEGNDLQPLLADGVAAATDQRGEACLGLMLAEGKEAGRQQEPAIRAFHEGQAVVDRDILAGVPKGYLKDSPLATGRADCAALPLVWEGHIYGVISIYSGEENSFEDEEMKLLNKMASDVALGLSYIEVKNSCRYVPATLRATRMAALGELCTGIAHEVNNLSNGIINYAQVLVDEEHDGEGAIAENEVPLNTIISEGERIAEIARKLLFYGSEEEQSREFVDIDTIIQDVLVLISHHLKIEGISFKVESVGDLPEVPLRVQDIHLVLMLLLNRARKSLNLKYPEKSLEKGMEITSLLEEEDGRKYLQVRIADHGTALDPETIAVVLGDDPAAEITDNETARNLKVCRELIEKGHRGRFAVGSGVDGQTLTSFSLPIQTGHQ